MLLVIGETVGKREGGYGTFLLVCNGLSFIGMVLGDGHKGRGVRGRGVFWENNGRLTFMTEKKKKMEQARREFLFVCPGENLRSLCFPFISGFPPPTASPPSPTPSVLFFSHHTISRSSSSPLSIPRTCGTEGFCRYKHTLRNPSDQAAPLSCLCFSSCCLPPYLLFSPWTPTPWSHPSPAVRFFFFLITPFLFFISL